MSKYTIQVSKAEYERFMEKKAKKARKEKEEKVKTRSESLLKKLGKRHSIDACLYSAFVDSDKGRVILSHEDFLYSSDDIDICGEIEGEEDIDMEDYMKTVLEAIPCSDDLKARISEFQQRVIKLNRDKANLVRDIEEDLRPAIWAEANEYVKKFAV
jgi:hypothetical protein